MNRLLQVGVIVALLALPTAPTWACACGCGIFEVGSSVMCPTDGAGGMVYVEYDFQDQTQNWSGSSRAAAGNNSDKEIRTHFLTMGVQYMFDNSWGMQVDVPFAQRKFTMIGGASGNDMVSLDWGQIGDVRIKGIYTGFSPDQSAGVTFGCKLPTGSYTHNDAFGDVDRDTQIGTGSTDLLLGGFLRGHLTEDGQWNWFAQAQLDLPVVTQDSYRPGTELNAGIGVIYQGWVIRGVRISPLFQVLGTERTCDCGMAASPDDTGYQRVLLSPGVELQAGRMMIHADVEVPVYQHVTGNQLTAPVLIKVIVGFRF